MARNKFDVDERLESPFKMAHLKRSLKYIRKHRWKMLLALLLSCTASIAGLFGPKLMQWSMDDAIPNRDVNLLVRLALIYIFVIIISIIFTTIRASIMARVSQDIIYDIRHDLFAHLQRLSFSYYDSRPAGKILVRVINYVNAVANMLSDGIINSILEIINIIFIIVFMFSTNVTLS
ncbi:MAG: ABC transporter transmembrane domain-containing protein, partial [Oscillospiraceae bacterium]|nr:ABC transporter transmembrane domain-containing protein [Oscillospiraceae bacterium]